MKWFACVTGLFFLLLLTSHSMAQTPEEFIHLLTPEEGSEVVVKRPYIRCKIDTRFSLENLFVTLDGRDVTGLIQATPEGFELQYVDILPPGQHTLEVVLYTEDGREVQRQFSFSTRHSEEFEEAYSENELTALYETRLKKPEDVDTVPHSRFESNLRSNTTLREKDWRVTLTTNVRFIDQSLPVNYPLKKGINLANYLLKAEYSSENVRFSSEVGDIQITETQNTVQSLGRRGGKLSVGFNGLTLSGFVVNSEQVFGFRGGMGIEGTPDDHIMGTSAELKLSDKLSLRAIYIRGGEKSPSYFGTWGIGGGRRGEVFGTVVRANLIGEKLTAETEVDFSRFDPDTKDEFPSEADRAYRVRLGGYAGMFSYEAVYEYMGPEYEVIGNQGLQKDREGFTIRTGMSLKGHSLNLSFSRYNDNVEDDELYPRTYTYQGTVNYTLNMIQNLSVGINYQKSVIDSTHEPPFTNPVRVDTDTVSGMASYTTGAFNIGLQISHSIRNDRTDDSNDTITTTYTLTPAYLTDKLSVSPNISFNRTEYKLTGVRTDTFTVSLDLRGDLLKRKITYEFGGTYNNTKSNDGTMDQSSYNASFRVAYCLKERLLGLQRPSLGIRGTYNLLKDDVYGQQNEELVLLLVLSTSIPFSL